MDRERFGIDIDVQTRWLLVSNRAPDENEIIALSKRAYAILPVVQHFKWMAVLADRIVRQDRRIVEE
jgi:hypothetical protein